MEELRACRVSEAAAAALATTTEGAMVVEARTSSSSRKGSRGSEGVIPLPSLDHTDATTPTTAGGAVIAEHTDDGPPLSIRLKRGLAQQEIVDMAIGNPVKRQNPNKPGLVVGTTTQYLKMMNRGKPLTVEYSEAHSSPAKLRWRTLMS